MLNLGGTVLWTGGPDQSCKEKEKRALESFSGHFLIVDTDLFSYLKPLLPCYTVSP